MLKIWLIFYFLHCCVGQPSRPHYMGRIRRYKADTILNMTYYLCKDATIKLWHADRVQQRYLGSLSYELGVITAGIQDIFKKMLTTYRKYSNLTNFRFGRYGIEEIMAAYHIVKGDFNALRMERNMFNDVLNTHHDRARIPKTTRFKIYQTRPGTQSRRGATVSFADKEKILRKRLKYEKWTEVDNMDIEDIVNGDGFD